MNFMELLPEEIIFLIFSYLNGDEIFPCLGVCKMWRSILNANRFWENICSKVRIYNHLSGSTDPLSLCDWAETYYWYRCVPYLHWKRGKCEHISIEQESGHFREAFDGYCMAVYYFTNGKSHLYSVYKKIKLIQVIKVPLVGYCASTNAMIALNDPYMVLSRSSVAIIYKKNTKKLYEPIRSVTATDTFVYDNSCMRPGYNRLMAEIAWGNIWITASSVKDICKINLNDFSMKYITAAAHLAFNDNVRLVVAWTKSSARILSTKGDVLISLFREKIRAVDFNDKYLVLKVENDLEVINIKTGLTNTLIKTSGTIEFTVFSTLILLEGNSTCSLSSISLESGNRIWTKEGLKGMAHTICTVGSKYLLVVPSMKKGCYSLVDYKGNFIRENVLPEGFREFYVGTNADILPYFVITNINSFDIYSSM